MGKGCGTGCFGHQSKGAGRLQAHKVSRRRLLGGGAAFFGASHPLFASAKGGGKGFGGHGGSRPLLIRGATLLTLDPQYGDLQGDMLVRHGKIVEIGPRVHAPGARVIDGTGKIVIPGFVDSHRHMWQGLLRNSGADELLADYLGRVLFGIGPQLTPDDVYLGNLMSALSALNAGVTTVLDWSHIATTSDHTDAAIDALEDARIRGVYAYGANAGVQPPWYQEADPFSAHPYPTDLFRLKTERFASDDQLLTLALAAGGPDFANMEAAAIEWQLARQAGVRITVHAGLGDPDSLVHLNAALISAGETGLADDTTYVHASNLSEASWELIAGTGGTVSLAVPVELQMGHGTPPIQRALDYGLRPSLSVDVETNNPTDMFHQMRSCFALQRGLLNAGRAFGDTSHVSQLLTARQTLELATIEGARANGLDAKIGTLSVGKSADFLMLDARALNVAPVNDPVAAVVLGMDTSNVEAVFIAGEVRKWQGKLVDVNVDQVIAQAESAQTALYQRLAGG